MAADPDVVTLSGDSIIEEARKRWNRCSEWEASFRAHFLDDMRFRYGDSDNMYQWPNAIRRSRSADAKPCLTMNIVRQHNLQIVNEAKKNKSAVKILAVGGDATAESAQVMQACVRHIEYQSNAQLAYAGAMEFQVDGGIGWWRIVTDYAEGDLEGNGLFNQEIFIRPIPDPLSVYMDPNIKLRDGADAQFAFVFSLMHKDEFKKEWPDFEHLASLQPLGVGISDNGWIEEDSVRLCEYFRVVSKKERLYSFIDPTDSARKTIFKSELPSQVAKEIQAHRLTRWRDVDRKTIEWKLIAGEKVIEETIWLGKFIPLIRVVGEETIVEGQLDRKGHTRAMKDSQRMFNYNASAQVEFVALQTKTPWVVAIKAVESLESYWANANTSNAAYLPYNHVDDSNPETVVPPPQRTQPPNESQAFQSGMETAFNQMMMVSGQYQNQLGMQGNERTGKAIGLRQQQGDTATFHFQDNYAVALQATGRQLIDLIPKVYDTERVIKVLADDGTAFEIQIDPGAQRAFTAKKNHQGEVIRRIFNPALGQYDIASDVGPSYMSKRQETLEVLGLILTQNPGLTGLVGDLLLKNLDIDEAQEAAARLRRMVPPQALGQGPSQNELMLQQQVQQLQGALTKVLDMAGKDKLKLIDKGTLRDVESYRAETDRMKALVDFLPMDRSGLEQMVQQLVEDTLKNSLTPMLQTISSGGTQGTVPQGASSPSPSGPPFPGSRQAPDGQWYLADPTRRGKFLRIAPLAQEREPKGVIANG